MHHMFTPFRPPNWALGAKDAARPFAVPSSPSTAAAEGYAFTGYGSVFGVVDAGGDVVMPGAFAASLARHKANGTRPRGLWQHYPDCPVLTWEGMNEDEHGLVCEGRLIPGLRQADDARILIEAGALDGLSIGFEVMAGGAEKCRTDDVERKYGVKLATSVHTAFDMPAEVRLLHALDLWEVSLVTFPMNSDARIMHGAAPGGRQSAVGNRGPEILRPAPKHQSPPAHHPSPPAHSAGLSEIAAALARRGAALSRIV